MKKAFPRFGLSNGILGHGHLTKRQEFPEAQSSGAKARMKLCPSRQALFVPLLAHERELLSSMSSAILTQRRTLARNLASELRSQLAQIGSIVYILSQQYELQPTPSQASSGPLCMPSAVARPGSSLIGNKHMLEDIIGKHQGIIRSIESLAREFSGGVRGAMILGQIAQRHREMAATLGRLVRSFLGSQA
jgi:hypothetical protein